jgi:hypothetical protein
MLWRNTGWSMVEYILGAAVALVILVAVAWQVAKSTQAKGSQTKTSIDAIPTPQESWP